MEDPFSKGGTGHPSPLGAFQRINRLARHPGDGHFRLQVMKGIQNSKAFLIQELLPLERAQDMMGALPEEDGLEMYLQRRVERMKRSPTEGDERFCCQPSNFHAVVPQRFDERGG